MTLTRLAFFRLLGAIGIGQAAKECTSKHPCLLGTPLDLTHIRPLDPEKQCLRELPGHNRFEEVRCDAGCEKGEENCPLGHCQKPDLFTVDEVILGSTTGRFVRQLRICSTCGIVYVPKGDK